MQCLGTVNAAEITLAHTHTPRFVTNIYKNIISAYTSDISLSIHSLE
jgi:hypothetical protein